MSRRYDKLRQVRLSGIILIARGGSPPMDSQMIYRISLKGVYPVFYKIPLVIDFVCCVGFGLFSFKKAVVHALRPHLTGFSIPR